MPLVLELTPASRPSSPKFPTNWPTMASRPNPSARAASPSRSLPPGLTLPPVEHMLHELLEQFAREEQSLNLEKIRTRIAASIACHAAIKVNMPLEQNKMEWLLAELAKTECPMTCPHGRPVVLRYSMKDIQRRSRESKPVASRQLQSPAKRRFADDRLS